MQGAGELARKCGQGALVAPRHALEVEVDTGEAEAPNLAHHDRDQGGLGARAVEQLIGPGGAGVVVLEHRPHRAAGRGGRGQGHSIRSALEAPVRLDLPAGGAEDGRLGGVRQRRRVRSGGAVRPKGESEPSRSRDGGRHRGPAELRGLEAGERERQRAVQHRPARRGQPGGNGEGGRRGRPGETQVGAVDPVELGLGEGGGEGGAVRGPFKDDLADDLSRPPPPGGSAHPGAIHHLEADHLLRAAGDVDHQLVLAGVGHGGDARRDPLGRAGEGDGVSVEGGGDHGGGEPRPLKTELQGRGNVRSAVVESRAPGGHDDQALGRHRRRAAGGRRSATSQG